MAESNGKEGGQQLVKDVLTFIISSVLMSVALTIIIHQRLQSRETRKPTLWERIAWLPWKLYYSVVYAAGALREKAVERLRREICEKWCECDC